VSNRLKRDGNPLLEKVQQVDPKVDEHDFHDALTANLRRGRFLLLIVGDGIREGVEAIAEYLQLHAGLHFSLGLVEMPIYRMPNGDRLVAPRVLARTAIVTRTVVVLKDGTVEETEEEDIEEPDPEQKARGDEFHHFWTKFLEVLKLDDPEQPMAKPFRKAAVRFLLPPPNSWIRVYRPRSQTGEVGLYLNSTEDTLGYYAMQAMVDNFDAIKGELGDSVTLRNTPSGRPTIGDSLTVGPLDQPGNRNSAIDWLAERVNTFVSVLRPRMRSAAADYQSRGE